MPNLLTDKSYGVQVDIGLKASPYATPHHKNQTWSSHCTDLAHLWNHGLQTIRCLLKNQLIAGQAGAAGSYQEGDGGGTEGPLGHQSWPRGGH